MLSSLRKLQRQHACVLCVLHGQRASHICSRKRSTALKRSPPYTPTKNWLLRSRHASMKTTTTNVLPSMLLLHASFLLLGRVSRISRHRCLLLHDMCLTYPSFFELGSAESRADYLREVVLREQRRPVDCLSHVHEAWRRRLALGLG